MRVAIIRALHLGDMLCATPALRSLRAKFRGAQFTLITLPWVHALRPHVARLVDEVMEFPGFPGIPERELDAARVLASLRAIQAREFDLVVQLHGSGSHINEFAMLCGGRKVAAFHKPGDAVASRGYFVPWPESGTEVERLCALPRALGCPETGRDLEFDVLPQDVVELSRMFGGRIPDNLVCVHPGARFASRRWAPERFAAIGDALAARGFEIVLTGTEGEASLTARVRNTMRTQPRDLAGLLSLGGFAALLGRAALVVCNDTGASHLAAAVGAKSVVIASGSDTARWAPMDAQLHRVLAHDVPCRPCMHSVCPTRHECASGIGVDDVLGVAEDLLRLEVAHV
jgi:ADP-heptose:LPS heptosyltransferase